MIVVAAEFMGASEGLGYLLVDGQQMGKPDQILAAIIAFALQVVAAPSEIDDADVEGLRDHGYGDEQIADVVGLVALNLLTGAFNLVAGIEPALQSRSEA
jgi:uncharacterized protein YciW